MKTSPDLETEIMSHQATREAIDSLADLFDDEFERTGITKAQFAERIGRDPSYVSRILNGRAANFTYLSLARMFVALGYWPTLTASRIDDGAEKCNFMPEHVEVPKVSYRSVEGAVAGKALNVAGPTVRVRTSPAFFSQAG
jgi:transcriptional regulator with XRE-family HTH domain